MAFEKDAADITEDTNLSEELGVQSKQRIAYDGDKPMNTHGGRTSYGHAFAASGMADVFEAVTQMRGEAGERQVKKLPKHTFLRGFGGAQNVRAIILRSGF